MNNIKMDYDLTFEDKNYKMFGIEIDETEEASLKVEDWIWASVYNALGVRWYEQFVGYDKVKDKSVFEALGIKFNSFSVNLEVVTTEIKKYTL